MDELSPEEREDKLTDEEVGTLEGALGVLHRLLSRTAQRRDALRREVAELQRVKDARSIGLA